jgi:uncharacterized membrane protein YuzA (DUF378 family)
MKTSFIKVKTSPCHRGESDHFTWKRNKEQLMKYANVITLLLVIVGAVNWGLMGLFQFDLVAALFGGPQAALSRVIYILVGVSGLYQIVPLLSAISSNEENPQLATSNRH